MAGSGLHFVRLWPLAVYFAAVLVLVAGMVGVSYLLGERHPPEAATNQPYESGIRPFGSARLRISAKYYLVALFFVIFDLESVFILAWSISVREAGWSGFVEMVFFSGVLLAGLIYLWRVGALDWNRIDRAEEAELQ